MMKDQEQVHLLPFHGHPCCCAFLSLLVCSPLDSFSSVNLIQSKPNQWERERKEEDQFDAQGYRYYGCYDCSFSLTRVSLSHTRGQSFMKKGEYIQCKILLSFLQRRREIMITVIILFCFNAILHLLLLFSLSLSPSSLSHIVFWFCLCMILSFCSYLSCSSLFRFLSPDCKAWAGTTATGDM